MMSLSFPSLLRPTVAHNPYLLVGASVTITLAIITAVKLAVQSTPKQITPSPRKVQLSKLSKKEQDDLPYPPDVFPGGRDVESPYGSIRVYEWGPESGTKVLIVHGITTPCIAVGSIAHDLVEKGFRVMLFDLFGRGYSDSPDLPHDIRLYSTQILLALTSSPLAWTPDGFNLVGYSLGGGIAAEFAVHFPKLVKELVLLAPAGLIRSYHFGWASRAVYSSLVPEALTLWITGKRLREASVQKSKDAKLKDEDTDKVVNAEISPDSESAILSKTRPGVTVAGAVQWQVENHEGFVGSFVSSIRHAPIENQVETWKQLAERQSKVLVIAGDTDAVIVYDELREDVFQYAGEGNVIWREIVGGHDFPITKGLEVVDIITKVWSP